MRSGLYEVCSGNGPRRRCKQFEGEYGLAKAMTAAQKVAKARGKAVAVRSGHTRKVVAFCTSTGCRELSKRKLSGVKRKGKCTRWSKGRKRCLKRSKR